MDGIKLSLLAVCILTATICAQAQERTSRQDITFIKKSEQLTQAIGWMHLSSDKWVSNGNAICEDKEPDTSKCKQNFRWIQNGSFNYKGAKYYVFFYNFLYGSYRYPSIQDGWNSTSFTSFMTMTSANYAKLKLTIEKNGGQNTDIEGITYDLLVTSGFDEAELLETITSKMSDKPSFPPHFWINAQTSNGQKVVRFMLPGVSSKSDFERTYFEVSTTEFKKLLVD